MLCLRGSGVSQGQRCDAAVNFAIGYVANGTFMYAKHGNLVESSTKHIESRLEVIQGHAFWDH